MAARSYPYVKLDVFTSVAFEGNQYLSDATLRRGVMLQPGTLYTRDAVLESQKRLFQSPAIARALVITPPAGDSVKEVTVAVAETSPAVVKLHFGFRLPTLSELMVCSVAA